MSGNRFHQSKSKLRRRRRHNGPPFTLSTKIASFLLFLIAVHTFGSIRVAFRPTAFPDSNERGLNVGVLQIPTRQDSGWWKLIIDTGYPTNDLFVAAVVMTPDRLPADPAIEDCSDAFMNVIEQVSNRGGGFVYAPEGEYLFTKPIDILPDVVIRGAWGDVSGTDKRVRGTIIKVTYGGLDTRRKDRGFIKLHHRSGLRDVTIWYPEQNLANVIPYARTIEMVKSNFIQEATLQNVNLVNSYIGIAPKKNVKRPIWSGIHGSPLKLGLYQAKSTDAPIYSNIHFSAEYWSGSGLPGAPSKEDLMDYLKEHSAGIKIGSSNNIFVAEWHVSDYNVGIHFLDEGWGTINGNMYGLHTSNCRIGALMESVGPSFIIESTFHAEREAVLLKRMQPAGLQFNGCRFESTNSSDAFTFEWNRNVTRRLTFQHCSFSSRLLAGPSDLTVVDSFFEYTDGPPIQLVNKTKSVLLAGNTFHYAQGHPVDLNDAEPERVKLDPNPTFSVTYTPFDVDAYEKERKPKASNFVVMGSPQYHVHVDGETDDSKAIQRALDDVASLGGGVVFLPQYNESGFAIRKPINIPDGVELRSSAEGMHSFDGLVSNIPAALLRIFHGRNGDEPCIILNSGSGFKGFTIHYPEQSTNDIVAYSVTVKAIGRGAYVQNNHFVNSYAAVEFRDSDMHLAENNMVEHLFRPFVVINCKGGRFNSNYIRDTWRQSNLSGFFNLKDSNAFSITNNVAYQVVDSRNQQLFASFSHMSRWLGVFENSTIHALQLSMEACHNGVKVNDIPEEEPAVELIGSSLRVDKDLHMKHMAVFEVSAKSSASGNFRVFSSLISGYPDSILKTENTNTIIQGSLFYLLKSKVGTHGIHLAGRHGSVARIESCAFEGSFVSTEIEDVPANRLELVGSRFENGVEDFAHGGAMVSTVDPTKVQPRTRIAKVATLVRPAVSAQLNFANPGSSGLILLSNEFKLETREFSSFRWFETTTGYAPTGQPKQLVFQVTSTPFISGDAKENATIEFYYYDWEAGEISVEFRLPGDESEWQRVGTINLQGDNGFQLPELFNAQKPKEYDHKNPHFHLANLTVSGRLFKDGTLIRLTVDGDAIFSFLSLTSHRTVF